jgi:hypothetical protein
VNDITDLITVTIDFRTMTYKLTGAHDGFPNYEMYINRQRIHHYEHGAYTPAALGPGLEIECDHPVLEITP